MATHIWTMMAGQIGKDLRGQLKDAAGAVNLDQFDSVAVLVARSATSALLVNAPSVPDADQSAEIFQTINGRSVSVSGKGWITFTTEEAAAALAKRQQGYLLSFLGMDGDTPYYFPLNKDAERTYGRLVVQDPLG